MEQLNLEIINLINEQQAVQDQMIENAKNIGDKDKYGYPFEAFDSFSMKPLEFLETAMRLHNEASETFCMLRELNRHSPLFYQMSSQLEKLISQLGSVCITKAVIEQQEGETFQLLEGLTIAWLRERTAFNFRKCYSSYMESLSLLHFNQAAMSLSLRWSALDKRLQATAEKIELIKSGKVKVDLRDKAEELKKQSDGAESTEKKDDPAQELDKTSALAPKAHALPIDKSAVREMEKQETEDVSVSESGPESTAAVMEEPTAASQETQIPDGENAGKEPESDTQNNTTQPEGTEVPDPSAETDICSEENEDPYEDDSDLYDEDDENLPYVSEELVRKMAEYYQSQKLTEWPFPELEFARSP